MHPALATLETAARQLQLSGELERSEFGRVMRGLRSVADGLRAVERRAAKQKAASVDVVELLRAALAAAAAGSPRGGEEILVEGPANDLRHLFSSLLEYARAVGTDAVEARTHIKEDGDIAGPKWVLQLVVQSPDLPDFLRRKLWDAARLRGGEVSVISEPTLCRIEFTLPIDRRFTAAD